MFKNFKLVGIVRPTMTDILLTLTGSVYHWPILQSRGTDVPVAVQPSSLADNFIKFHELEV